MYVYALYILNRTERCVIEQNLFVCIKSFHWVEYDVKYKKKNFRLNFVLILSEKVKTFKKAMGLFGKSQQRDPKEQVNQLNAVKTLKHHFFKNRFLHKKEIS